MTSENRLLSPDESADEIPDYRPLSMRAVFCFVLALASYFAFVHYLLWILPLVAVFASLSTIRFLRRSDVPFTGRKLAYAALIMTAIPLAGAPTEAIVWRVIVMKQARYFAEEWVQLLLNGEKKRAHYWTLARSARPKSEASYVRYYRDPTYLDQVEQYYARKPQSLLVGKPGIEAEWQQANGVAGGIRSCRISHNFLIHYEDGSQGMILVDVLREVEPTENQVHWEILSIREVEPDGGSPTHSH